MIFVTTGSRSFQFNRLLKAIDDAIAEGKITNSVFAQIGSSNYQIKNYNYTQFLNQDEFNNNISNCEIVLTHGGTGVIVNALKLGKRVVAIPRLAQYGEAVDDHQIQLIRAFDKLGMVTPCYECTSDGISAAINEAKSKEVKPYVSNTQNIIGSIEELLRSNIKDISKKKIRILMCSSARTEKGGMNSVIDQLMDHKWDANLEFSYLATHISGNVVKKTLYFAKAYKDLKKLLKKDTFDVIHIHMSYKGSFYRKYYVAKICKKYGKRIIIHLHGSEFKDFYYQGNLKTKKQIKELFTIADYTIVLGESWKHFIEKIAPESRIIVINNAIRIPDIAKKKENDIPVLLFLGALIKRKGLIDLLCTIKKLKDQRIADFKLRIAGTGDEEDALKDYVNQNAIEEMVEFLGWVKNDQKPELLSSSDILVLPSYNEGLPVAILEAISYGLPVISTNVGSIAEAVIDNYNGYLYEPGDLNKLAISLHKIVSEREKWENMSANSRGIAETRFSEDVFFEKINKLYFELGRK